MIAPGPSDPDSTEFDVTHFIFIENRRRLTLQVCERPRGLYSWFLSGAQCQAGGFRPDQLLASGEGVASEPAARDEAMTALLAHKRLANAETAPSPTSFPAHSLVQPAPDVMEQLIAQVTWRVNDLTALLDTIQQRVAILKASAASKSRLPSESDPYSSEASASASHAWRLIERRFILLSPDGTSVALSKAQRRFLLELFRSPDSRLTYAQASAAIAEGLEKSDRSYGAVKVSVSRLRAKFLAQGLHLPLYTVRGKGYSFVGESTILTM